MKKVNKTNVIFPIKVFEVFAGIGAQRKAITNIDPENKYFKVEKTSEWDARAVISYAQIHHKKLFDKELKKIQKMTPNEIASFFSNKTFSLDSKKPAKILRKKLNFQQNLMAATIVNKNLPDINAIKGGELKDIDLLTYSFPCQGLSIANMGRDVGIKENNNSTSNLIWQIKRLLMEAKEQKIILPKYLLMENVKNLISKKHKKDYIEWKKFLSSLNYKTKTLVLNGLDYGSIQKRKRVFAISIFNWKTNLSDEKFQLNFQNQFKHKKLNKYKRKQEYKRIFKSSNKYLDEIQDATPNNTSSRKKMLKKNCNLSLGEKNNWILKTLTTKQDRHPNIGMIKLENKNLNKLKGRFITTREAYQIMGFKSKDFSQVKKKYNEKILTKESLYRQAGNSIIVSKLESIFEYIKILENKNYE